MYCTTVIHMTVYALYRKAVQLLSWVCYCMFYESTVCTIDFYKPGCTTHSVQWIATLVCCHLLICLVLDVIASYIDLTHRITFETSECATPGLKGQSQKTENTILTLVLKILLLAVDSIYCTIS